jgi:hypothetical protein
VNRKGTQCVLTTKLRLFEWSSGEVYNVWVHNLVVRHVPTEPYKNIDLLYWNMKQPYSRTRGYADPYVKDTRVWLTYVNVVSTGQKPALEPTYQTVEQSVTGVYVEGGLVHMHGASADHPGL